MSPIHLVTALKPKVISRCELPDAPLGTPSAMHRTGDESSLFPTANPRKGAGNGHRIPLIPHHQPANAFLTHKVVHTANRRGGHPLYTLRPLLSGCVPILFLLQASFLCFLFSDSICLIDSISIHTEITVTISPL